MNTYIHPFLLDPATPLSHPSRSSQSTRPSFLCYTATSHQLFYARQCTYVHLSPSHLLLPPLCSQVRLLCLHLCRLQIAFPSVFSKNQQYSGLYSLENFSLPHFVFVLCICFISFSCPRWLDSFTNSMDMNLANSRRQ